MENSIIEVQLRGHGVEQFSTPRLIGRRLLPADLDFLVELHASPVVMGHSGGPRTAASTEPFVRSNVAHWRYYQFGLYVLSPADDPDRPIGRAGLRWDRRDGETPSADVSVVLTEAAWGRGYAVEAGTAMVTIARSLELPVTAGCRADHAVARAVLEKIGFVHTENQLRNGEDWVRYRWPEDGRSPARLVPHPAESHR